MGFEELEPCLKSYQSLFSIIPALVVQLVDSLLKKHILRIHYQVGHRCKIVDFNYMYLLMH